jgi:hypothetical protein
MTPRGNQTSQQKLGGRSFGGSLPIRSVERYRENGPKRVTTVTQLGSDLCHFGVSSAELLNSRHSVIFALERSAGETADQALVEPGVAY